MQTKRNVNIFEIDINAFLCFVAAITLCFYMFCAHFRFPFPSTYFLYFSFAVTVAIMLLKSKWMIYNQVLLYIAILFITFIGMLYSQNQERASRQLIFFLLYLFFFWLAMQDIVFLSYIMNAMYLLAFIGMITVYIQFINPTAFNSFLRKLIYTSAYQDVMWSFKVDGAFTGITASVSMAAYSMCIVFFKIVNETIQLVFKKNELAQDETVRKNPRLKVVFNIIIAIAALFGIILTSKRGIFLATVIALLLSVMLDKDIAKRKINAQSFVLISITIALLLILGINVFSKNEYIIAFAERFSGKNITTGRDVFYEKALNDISKGNISLLLFGRGTASAYSVNDTGIHNVYLQILYDHGILGLVVFLWFFLHNLRQAVKNRYFRSISMQIVFLVYCMSGNPLYDYYFFIPYLLYVCYPE